MKEVAVKETRSGRSDLTSSIFCSSLQAFSHSPVETKVLFKQDVLYKFYSQTGQDKKANMITNQDFGGIQLSFLNTVIL